MSLAAVERLFARHNLGPVEYVEPLQGGQLNRVLRVNEGYVLRWREPSLATGSLRREALVLERVRGRVPTAEVVASGMDDLLGEYLVLTHVPGRRLLSCWLENPDVSTREWWMVQWTAALRALHEERYPRAGELFNGEVREAPSWRAYLEGRIRKRLDGLMRVAGVDREFVLAAERYLRRQAPVLEDGPFCLIHRDLHFNNVLVDGPDLAAILDFELAEVGPPDYELDAIYRFLRYPWLYLEAGTAARVSPSRFASVWIRLKRGYPSLFTTPHLRERLALYALDQALSCLNQAYGGRPGASALAEPTMDRIAEILQDRYGPER